MLRITKVLKVKTGGLRALKNHFLNVRLDGELNSLVEKAKADYFINPCQLVRKLLRNALKEIIKGETKNV